MTSFNLSAWAVRERTLTLFLILAVLIAGAFAFWHLGRAEDPQFTVKVMTVAAHWPGATAKEMVEQVGDRLEKRLQELEYYDRAETAAYPSVILMKVFFQDYIPPERLPEEFYQARKKLGDEAGNLPKGVIGPLMNDEFSDVYFALYALKAKGLPHRQLVLEAETIRQRLLRVHGVEKVNILGEQAQRIYGLLATFGEEGVTQYAASPQQEECSLSHLARGSLIPRLTICRGDTTPVPRHRHREARP